MLGSCRPASRLGVPDRLGRIALLLVGLSAVLAIGLSVPQVAGVFRCLTEMHCGANKASGWFFLVALGVCYVTFEIVSAVALAVARRLGGVAT